MMPRVDRIDDIRVYHDSAEMKRIGNRAVQKAQETNRKLGIPNVFSRNQQIYHESESGDIVKGNPYS